MSEQYFTSAPTSAHEERHVQFQAGSRCLRFETDAGTFSKGHLDPGSRLLIDTVPNMTGRCADIGCGWGAIGAALAALNPELFVEMVDVNERAVALAQKNLEANRLANARAYLSDALTGVESGLDFCVTNPPIRAGKAVIYGFFTQAAEKFKPGGKLYIVIRKQQGAPSAMKYLATIFEKVSVLEKEAGYWIIEAIRAE